MSELQAEQVLAILADMQLQMVDVNDWLSQITTHIYWLSTVILPLIAFCMIIWWVLKRYMY